MTETQRTRDTRRKGRDDGAVVWLELEQQTAKARRSDIKAAKDRTKDRANDKGMDRGKDRTMDEIRRVNPG